jgi:phage shock protein PspC (stress-responsive transcriptional regulator)
MSTADEVAKLHDLLNKGAISQAEFDQAKARLLGAGTMANAGAAVNRLRLSDEDRWIGGVCGGIGALTGVDAWVWRLVFVLGLLLGGFTLLLYVLLWILVPRQGA